MPAIAKKLHGGPFPPNNNPQDSQSQKLEKKAGSLNMSIYEQNNEVRE